MVQFNFTFWFHILIGSLQKKETCKERSVTQSFENLPRKFKLIPEKNRRHSFLTEVVWNTVNLWTWTLYVYKQ